MEADADYSIRLERIHFRTSLLVYRQGERHLTVYLEQSYSPDIDWSGLEDDFRYWTYPCLNISEEERKLILSRLEQWSAQTGVRIYIGPPADLTK